LTIPAQDPYAKNLEILFQGMFGINMLHPLYKLLRKLEDAHIHFTLGRYRENTILVL
jgi:hypothetical protein